MKRTDGQAAPEDESEDDGRSTAFWIAIGLVVAIPFLIVVTVIGSAVIGAFVLGVSDGGGQQPPQVSYTGDSDDGSVTFTITGGDSVRGDRLGLVVDGTERRNWSRPSGTLQEGDTITVRDAGVDNVVQITWTDPETGSTFVIIEWDLRR